MDLKVEAVFISSLNLGHESIQVFDAKTGANIKSYRGACITPSTLNCIGLSDYIISGQKDKPLLQVWTINKNDPIEKRFPVPGRVNIVAVNATGPKHCVVGIKEKMYVYNLLYGRYYGVINRHYQTVSCIRFTSCGNYFASGGADGFIYLWSMASLIDSLHQVDEPQVKPHYILGQHSDKVTGMCLTENGMRGVLISCSYDCSIKIFDLITGQLRNNLIFSSMLASIAVDPMGLRLYAGDNGGKVWGVDLLPFLQEQDVEITDQGMVCHEKDVLCLAVMSYSNIIITGGADGDVKLWSVAKSSREKGPDAVTFALQRTLHHGRGAITNLMTGTFQREVFNSLEFDSRITISAFSNQRTISIHDTAVVMPIKKREELDLTNELYAGALRLLRHRERMKSINIEDTPTPEKVLKKVNKEFTNNYKSKLKEILKANEEPQKKMRAKDYIIYA